MHFRYIRFFLVALTHVVVYLLYYFGDTPIIFTIYRDEFVVLFRKIQFESNLNSINVISKSLTTPSLQTTAWSNLFF